jgi:hypothetical protein
MQGSALLAAIRQEIHRHDPPHFMDEENKRVVPGCPKCRKPFYTVPQLLDHLSDAYCLRCWTGCQIRLG